MLIFLFNLTLPITAKKLLFYQIIIIELLIMLEYIWQIVDQLIIKSEYMINILQFLTECTSSNGIDIRMLLILYCFYFQYKINNSEYFKNFSHDTFLISILMNRWLKGNSILRSIVDVCGTVIKSLYIWILLFTAFSVTFIFGISVFFSIKLILIFLITFKFLLNKDNILIVYIWINIVYCFIDTLIIYFYQFTSFSIFKNYISGLNWQSEIMLNLDLIGLKYFSNFDIYFYLPYHLSNFISVLIYHEVKRMINEANEDDRVRNLRELALKFEIDSKLKEGDKDNPNNKNESTKSDINKLAYLEFLGSKKLQKRHDTKKIHYSCFKFYFLYCIYLIFKVFWLIILLTLGLLFLFYQMSISIIIYLSIYIVSFLFMFSKFVTFLDSENNIGKSKSNKHYVRYSKIY